MTEAWAGEGVMVNSGPLDGIPAGKGEGQSVKAASRFVATARQGQRRYHLSSARLVD
jgi:leucyl-tRNA synthetase